MSITDYKVAASIIRAARKEVWKCLGKPDMRKLDEVAKPRHMGMSFFQATRSWNSILVVMFPHKWHTNWRPWQDFSADKRVKSMWHETGWSK